MQFTVFASFFWLFFLQLISMEKKLSTNEQIFLTWELAGDSSYPPPAETLLKPHTCLELKIEERRKGSKQPSVKWLKALYPPL